jgi:hypothetical protein
MSSPVRFALLIGILAAAGTMVGTGFARAADLQVAPTRYAATLWCGCCGCLQVSHMHHRELRTTYGTGFDPRNYDSQEPHYYFGPMRSYPRYWVTAAPPY